MLEVIAMAYEGELLNGCGTVDLDFSEVDVVAVSGLAPTFAGTFCSMSEAVAGTTFMWLRSTASLAT